MKVQVYALKPKKTWYPLIISYLIMWLGKTKFSHMALGYKSMTGTSKIIDARWLVGVNDMVAERFFKKYDVINFVTLELHCSQYQFMEWVEEQEGKDYPFYQLLALTPKVLGLAKSNSHGRGYNGMICNEVILSALERFGDVEIGDPDNYDLNETWKVVNDFH